MRQFVLPWGKRQMKKTFNQRKVLLFIVEGYTDKQSLEYPITQLAVSSRIVFQTTSGDITSRDGITRENVRNKLYDYVKQNKTKNKFKDSDYYKIVHIIDTDGAFIPDDYLFAAEESTRVFPFLPYYASEGIYCADVSKIAARNRQKSELVEELLQIGTLGRFKIPYEVYFMSTNLEHVLHNNANVPDEQKPILADQALKDFYCSSNGLLALLNSLEVFIPGTYSDTWAYIRDNTNSLRRCSNLSVFFRQEKLAGTMK